MKRLILPSLALLAVLAFTSASFAASATVNLTVTVTSGDVSITNTTDPGSLPLKFGSMIISTSARSTQGTFSNTGDTTADWSIEATAFGNGTDSWTLLDTGAPGDATGVNTVRLAAIWGNWQNAPAIGDFGAEDVVTTTPKVSSATDFARAADADSFKGFNVGAGTPRDIWFQLDAPASGSAGLTTEMTSTVTVTAAIH